MGDYVEVAVLEDAAKKGFCVWTSSQGDRAVHRVAYDDEDVMIAEGFVKGVEEMIAGKRRLGATEMAKLRNALFNLLFRDDSLRLYGRLTPKSVSVVIASADARVLNMPWEYFGDPTGAVGPNQLRPVVRAVPMVGVPSPQSPPPKSVRVLFVAAEPADLDATSWQDQEKLLQQQFADYNPKAVGPPDVLRKPTRKDLRKKIRNGEYDVVHFTGHGQDGGVFLLDAQQGLRDLVSANDFANLMAGRGIRLVVLASCRSAAGSFDESFGVVATALVRSGIPAVLAMQYSVDPETAAMCVAEFYDGLLTRGLDLDTAAAESRHAIATTLGTASVEWGIPVLYRSLDAKNPFR